MNDLTKKTESLKLLPELLQVMAELNFTQLTSVQAEAIPLLLQGRDLVGQSRTGSGKTLAFALPMVNGLNFQDRGPQALVLCPTRELSDQVAREIRKIGRRLSQLKVVSLVGGQPVFPQANSLRRGALVAVGTPGRVLDHLRRGSLEMENIKFLVLDEADRMLDMGFQEEMEEVLAALPSQRQMVFFSATFPTSIEEMSERYQNNPARVTIKETESAGPPIQQLVYELSEEEKIPTLLACLSERQPESAIIFCNLKVTVAALSQELENHGLSAAALHGDLDQNDRDRIMAKFRNGSVRVLVATDVAARGIDVADLDLVLNFELPKPDIYVHRIGRTGRAGKSGLAISFQSKGDSYKLRMIEDKTGQKVERVAPPQPTETAIKADAKMVTFFISGGRKEKVRPGDILGALTGEAGGLNAKDVGKIEIHDRFAYVAVSRDVAETALEALRNGKIKGRKFRIELVL